MERKGYTRTRNQLSPKQRQRILPIVEEADIDLDEQLFIKRSVEWKTPHLLKWTKGVTFHFDNDFKGLVISLVNTQVMHFFPRTVTLNFLMILRVFQKIPMFFLESRQVKSFAEN